MFKKLLKYASIALLIGIYVPIAICALYVATVSPNYKTYRTIDQLVEKPWVEKYNDKIAPFQMKQEMVELYAHSKDSLEKIANHLTEKYKINISSSTVSKYCRENLHLKKRNQGKYLKI